MARHITQEDVEKVAALARLDLTDAEKKRTVAEFESILSYMDRLVKVDTSAVEPYAASPAMSSALREDVAMPFADRDALLADGRFKDNLLVTKGVFSKGSKGTEDAA